MGHHHDHTGQSHAHSHAHTHSHAGSPTEEFTRAPRAELPPGAGQGQVLFLDAPSGLAGDMTIAALIALGVPESVVQDAVNALELDGIVPEFRWSSINAIRAGAFRVVELTPQPHRDYQGIDALIRESRLDAPTKSLARRIFRCLAEAESEVHGVAIETVHFHEVGAADAICDIVGAAACLSYLGAELVVSPLPMGHGQVKCAHGVLPLPAPATVLCLRGVPTYEAGIEAELVTPTGAAIVATAASRFVRWPSLSATRVGFGRGTKEFADRTNAVRAVLGHSGAKPSHPGTPGEESAGDGDACDSSFQSLATHWVLEANVDDMTGELAAHAISELLQAGALDAWATPIVMKKGRPGLVVSALVRTADKERGTHCLLSETTSIGLRLYPVERTERPRQIVEVQTEYGVVPVKVSAGDFGGHQVKPEFDVCARLARDAQVSVRQVLAAAVAAWSERG